MEKTNFCTNKQIVEGLGFKFEHIWQVHMYL